MAKKMRRVSFRPRPSAGDSVIEPIGLGEDGIIPPLRPSGAVFEKISSGSAGRGMARAMPGAGGGGGGTGGRDKGGSGGGALPAEAVGFANISSGGVFNGRLFG